MNQLLKQLPYLMIAIAVIGLIGIKVIASSTASKQTAYNNISSVFDSHTTTPAKTAAAIKLYGSVGITIIVLAGSLFILFSGQYKEVDMKWALGSLGVIAGYWIS